MLYYILIKCENKPTVGFHYLHLFSKLTKFQDDQIYHVINKCLNSSFCRSK